MNTQILSPLIAESEVARLLGVSVKKLQRDRYVGQGVPYYKLGKSVRYKISDVENYLGSNRY